MVSYVRDGSVVILEVKNPPVNALSHHVRVGLRDGLLRANKDSSVESIVIYGGKTFLAGADIKEFSSGAAAQDPSLTDVCKYIESNPKPVVAAIEGYAFGGGLEVAISTHYRVAHAKALFGFPEVDLGILPGAHGTQRFPRLTGLQFALEVIPTGKRFDTRTALKNGVIDQIAQRDVLIEAVEFAHKIAGKSVDERRTSGMTIRDADKAVSIRDAAVVKINRRQPGLMAPLLALKSVMASVENSFDKGCEIERSLFMTLMSSGQSSALRYAFFAQRKATQWSLRDGSSYKTTKSLPVRSVGVIGAGTMGSGIAMIILNIGIPVVLVEQDERALEAGINTLKTLYRESVALGLTSAEDAKARMTKLKPSISYTDLREVDMVIEAVYEKMSLKQAVFRKLDDVCKPDAILCSNTSALSIDEIASVTRRPGSVIGMHFFAPSYYMKIVENIRGEHTTPAAIATACTFGKAIGKVPVLVGNCTGFVANRAMKPRYVECLFLIEEGCSPEDLDRASEDFGFPIGPMKVADLSGLDIGTSQLQETMKALGTTIDSNTRYLNEGRFSPLSFLLVNEKRLGRKSGAGWYNYDKPGAKIARSSEFVRNMVEKYRKQHRIPIRKISTQEITERLVYCVINESFKILEEGIVNNPEEIDTILILGYGWPKQTGGPMFYANTIGLGEIYSKICLLSRQHSTSPHWSPSALLKSLAENNVPFDKWHSHAAGAQFATTSRL